MLAARAPGGAGAGPVPVLRCLPESRAEALVVASTYTDRSQRDERGTSLGRRIPDERGRRAHSILEKLRIPNSLMSFARSSSTSEPGIPLGSGRRRARPNACHRSACGRVRPARNRLSRRMLRHHRWRVSLPLPSAPIGARSPMPRGPSMHLRDANATANRRAACPYTPPGARVPYSRSAPRNSCTHYAAATDRIRTV